MRNFIVNTIAFLIVIILRLFDELVRYNLINKAVASGETVYGIIGIQPNQFLSLTMRFY